MKKIFGANKNKVPPPTIQDATERINKRGETVDDKIKKLDEELARYEKQTRKTRPAPSQEAIKARAIRLLKHKRMYEEQRNMLYNQTCNLDQVAFAADGLKDAHQTMNAMKAANKELKGRMKTVKVEDIDSRMLWRLIWSLRQVQSHHIFNQTRNVILMLSLIYPLHPLVLQQSH